MSDTNDNNDNNNPSSILTLTPATIAAIELAASAEYGLRLRHVPDEVHAQVELDKGKAPAKKAPTNKPAKTDKPLTYEQVAKLVTSKLKKQAQAKADSLIQALGSSKVWERHRPRLLADKVIVGKGNGRGMVYSLGAGEE